MTHSKNQYAYGSVGTSPPIDSAVVSDVINAGFAGSHTYNFLYPTQPVNGNLLIAILVQDYFSDPAGFSCSDPNWQAGPTWAVGDGHGNSNVTQIWTYPNNVVPAMTTGASWTSSLVGAWRIGYLEVTNMALVAPLDTYNFDAGVGKTSHIVLATPTVHRNELVVTWVEVSHTDEPMNEFGAPWTDLVVGFGSHIDISVAYRANLAVGSAPVADNSWTDSAIYTCGIASFKSINADTGGISVPITEVIGHAQNNKSGYISRR